MLRQHIENETKKILFNLWNLELQDIMEIESIHNFKKWFGKLQEVVKDW